MYIPKYNLLILYNVFKDDHLVLYNELLSPSLGKTISPVRSIL